MAHDIAEVYALMKAAREGKVRTQMATRGTTGADPSACEYIWAGPSARSPRPTRSWPRLRRERRAARLQARAGPPPLDEWLGPPPSANTTTGCTPSAAVLADFGTGTIGDMACHNLDASSGR